MTSEEARAIVAAIECSLRTITVYEEHGLPFLRVSYLDADAEHPERGTLTMRGRPWALHECQDAGEVVRTAFLAVLTSLEHQAREWFRYMGEPIFGPHFEVDAPVFADWSVLPGRG